MDLITKAEYKAYAGITSTNKDAEVDALIPRISALIKTYCNRTFIDYYSAPKVEYFNGPAMYFYLSECPIVNVSSVEFSSDYGNTYSDLIEYTDYAVDRTRGTIHSLQFDGFQEYINGYKVSYTGGYSSVPEDLKLAALDLVSYYLRNDASIHSNKAPGTNSVQVEYISTTTLPAHIRRVLDLYKADYT